MFLIEALRRAIASVARQFEHARAIRQLQAMSDRDLRDIGIARAEIDALVTGQLIRPNVDPALVRPAGAANRRGAPVALDAAEAA